MKHIATALIALVSLLAMPHAQAQALWIEGKQYFRLDPSKFPPLPAGTAEVTEVFSYGCPACYRFTPIEQRIKARLPSHAKVSYLPASFIPAENWPVFQRAYLTAKSLGVAEQAHEAMYEAVWKTGELAIRDEKTRRAKNPLPSIEDVARFYNRVTGVSVEEFVTTAKSPEIEAQMKAADALVIAYETPGTPTIIVNRRYRVTASSAGGYDQLIDLVSWLVVKDGAPRT